MNFVFANFPEVRMRRFFFLFLLLLTFPAISSAQEETPTPVPTVAGRIWTLEEILAEPLKEDKKGRVRYCKGGRFKPCVCPEFVSKFARYRPSVQECGGDAAIVLSGRYLNVFSVVVRDSENRDRWPTAGFGKCTAFERDTLGLNKCSAFKVQKILLAKNEQTRARVHCLGASGYSTLFKRVTRMTAKLSDIPGSTDDPLVRWCLNSPRQPLN